MFQENRGRNFLWQVGSCFTEQVLHFEKVRATVAQRYDRQLCIRTTHLGTALRDRTVMIEPDPFPGMGVLRGQEMLLTRRWTFKIWIGYCRFAPMPFLTETCHYCQCRAAKVLLSAMRDGVFPIMSREFGRPGPRLLSLSLSRQLVTHGKICKKTHLRP